MNRLYDIQEQLNDLMQMDPSELAKCRHFEDYADDICRKLAFLRGSTISPPSPLSLSPALSPRHTRTLLTPPSSIASSSSTDSWPDCSDVAQSARKAFDNEIYARCVQIVESAAKEGNIDCTLISLAHNSYLCMVDMAEDSVDARKLSQWWNAFLESVETKNRGLVERIELLDYRTTALERQIQIDGGRKKVAATKLLHVLCKAYQLTTALFRPFHSKSVRRLERLVLWTDELESMMKDFSELQEIHTSIELAVERTMKDRQRYVRETGADERDAEFTMCSSIVDAICTSIGAEPIQNENFSPNDSGIDELLSKVFPGGSLPDLPSPVAGQPLIMHF